MNQTFRPVRRGDIYYAEIPETNGSVYRGIRPILIVSNNANNKYSRVITAVPLTSRMGKSHLPTHVLLPKEEKGLRQNSLAMCENICNYSVDILREYVSRIEENSPLMKAIEHAICVQVGIA